MSDQAKKLTYTLLGTLSLILGVIGIILPVLPTTPFILFSAWCYIRGSKRLHDWLINHPQLGEIVREYGDGEGMTMKSKQKAITATWIAVTLTTVFILDTLLTRGLILIVAVLGTIIVLKVKTRKQEK